MKTIPENNELNIEPYILKNDIRSQAWIVSSSRKTHISKYLL